LEKPEETKQKEGDAQGSAPKAEPPATPSPVVIDLEGITERVVAFPVPEGLYGQVAGIKGKALFTSFPVEGALDRSWVPGEPAAKGTLEVYDFEEQKHEPLLSGITDFQLAKDGKTLVYRAGNKLRVIRAGQKPEEPPAGTQPAGSSPNPAGGVAQGRGE